MVEFGENRDACCRSIKTKTGVKSINENNTYHIFGRMDYRAISMMRSSHFFADLRIGEPLCRCVSFFGVVILRGGTDCVPNLCCVIRNNTRDLNLAVS